MTFRTLLTNRRALTLLTTLALSSSLVARPLLYADSADGIPFKERPVVLDENGKPCKTCNSLRTFLQARPSPKPTGSTGTSSSTTGAAAATATATALALSTTPFETEVDRSSCPPDIEQLGRSTWTFLHAMASALPLQIPPDLQPHVVGLLISLTHLYPCSHCRSDFASSVQAAGGKEALEEVVRTREGVERWVCERHNEVNRKLGKEGFDCKLVSERWRDGHKDGRCDSLW